MTIQTDIRHALDHIRNNVAPWLIGNAIGECYRQSASIFDVDPMLADQIADLMDDYGLANGLPKDWWRSATDEDDILQLLREPWHRAATDK